MDNPIRRRDFVKVLGASGAVAAAVACADPPENPTPAASPSPPDYCADFWTSAYQAIDD